MRTFILLFSALTALAIAGLVVSLKPRLYVTTSDSMSPAINKGDVLIVREAEIYVPGEVVSFKSKEGKSGVVTHRITARHNNQGEISYNTKGDANDLPDASRVKHEQIMGRVIKIIPKVGFVLMLPTAWYQLSLLWLISLVIVFHEIANIITVIKKRPIG
jgi:signal peptidase